MFADKLLFLHELSTTLVSDTSRSVSISLLEPGFIRTDSFKTAGLSLTALSLKEDWEA